ncbi:MAG: RpoL/Rpb11 RNA polymerase subunit family protein [Candidatus Methanospirareceae archaeon]
MMRIIERGEKEVKIEVEGEDHTILAPLRSKLLENENVIIATYTIKHPLLSKPELYVKMREGDPLEAIKLALSSLYLEFEEFENKFKAAIV